MSDSILVTGATGTLGRVLVRQLSKSGLPTRALSRRRDAVFPAGVEQVTGDLLSGAGLPEAVSGVRAIVHCATNYRRPTDDVFATRRLIEAASPRIGRGGDAPHLIYVSIVGADRIPLKMYHYKAGIEGMIERSGLPWTIQRATQFHDLLRTILGYAGRLPIMPLPAGIRFQPIDPGDLACKLTDLALGEPAGRVPDIGGPEIRTIEDLARSYLGAAGRQRRIASIWLPGKLVAGFRQGRNLAPDNPAGVVTFEQFLQRTGPR